MKIDISTANICAKVPKNKMLYRTIILGFLDNTSLLKINPDISVNINTINKFSPPFDLISYSIELKFKANCRIGLEKINIATAKTKYITMFLTLIVIFLKKYVTKKASADT